MFVTATLHRPDDAWEGLDELYSPRLVTSVINAVSGRLPPTGLNYVAAAMHAPARAASSTPRSSSGAYPSAKVGRTIGYDSATIELPIEVHLERGHQYVAYFNQPPAIPITAADASGRRRTWYSTPDFLVICSDGRGLLIEGKSLQKIHETNDRRPGFFMWDGHRWRCPAAEASARTYGLAYEVWTEESLPALERRNSEFLDTYLKGQPGIYQQALKQLRTLMDTEAELTLAQAIRVVGPDAVYFAVATNAVSADLNSNLLTNAQDFRIYRDEATRIAHETALAMQVTGVNDPGKATTRLAAGDAFLRNGRRWECLSISGADALWMTPSGPQPLPVSAFLHMLKTGEIAPIEAGGATSNPTIGALLGRASEKSLGEANRRMQLIQPYLDDPSAKSPRERSTRRYLHSFRLAERRYGCGYVGLLPRHFDAPARKPILLAEVMQIAKTRIENFYLQKERPSKKATYNLIASDCNTSNYRPPSYAWVCRFIDHIDKFRAALARTGRKGAYKLEPRIPFDPDNVGPHAQRAFSVAHVDHTLIDLATHEPGADKADRLWLTVLLCAYTRRVLAFSLTYEPPSYRSVIRVLRECVRRHHRLPDAIVVDGGKEFQSSWFETACAMYHIRLHRRAKAKPRYGAEIERNFGTLNTCLLHNLVGNTQNTRNVRQLTSEIDPYKAAIWNMESVNGLLNRYFHEVYDTTTHSGTLRTPRQMFEASLQEHGHAPHRLIAYDELFQILTSATTRSGKAKVQPDGVVINYLQYSHPDLMKHLGKSLPVRYDPFNLSIAWAQVDATWVQLTSRHASILMNFSEFDVKAVTEAWHRRRSDVKRDRLTDSSLAALLQDAMEQEKALSQAKRDLLAGPSPDACSDRLANDSIEGLPLHDATGVFASDDIDDSSIELCEDF